ncbi:TRRAP-like protein [Mya arenaria]|uniref:TRRAP-like protein n=1 Tax=Mya arenaria TaxID=6604 RepID=A0ABY7D9N6_MYAAR|nr:TRRAP-like protein [Mya arenaria]
MDICKSKLKILLSTIRCSKELNQWDHLLEYANSKGNTNPHLVLESAWRVPNWALMKDALSQVELSCPKEMAWKVNLYRGYIAICHPDDHHLNMIERLVELSSNLAIKEWRRLPHIVTHIHVPLLQLSVTLLSRSIGVFLILSTIYIAPPTD